MKEPFYECVNGCADCERLQPEYQRARDEQARMDELVRIALEFLGDGSVTVGQLRQAARNAHERLEALQLALQKHHAAHRQRDGVR